MSIAGGIDKAFYAGASINCTAIQVFTHSNRQWAAKDLTKENIATIKQAQKETEIEHVVVHASYLVNLGSATADIVKKSQHALEKELALCELLGFPFLVLHPGAGLTDQKACIKQISNALNEVLEKSTGSTKVLFEIMAGQGSSVGYTFEQLAELKSGISHKNRIGFCIDTCHLWAAGYDFSTKRGIMPYGRNLTPSLGTII